MASIYSRIGTEKYQIEISTPSGNELTADEPLEMGGQDLGFSPKELLAASLAACTSATLRMYADRKEWDLQEVKIKIDLDFLAQESKTIINRELELIGNLNEQQRKRLLDIANACPVHKMLSNPFEISTRKVSSAV